MAAHVVAIPETMYDWRGFTSGAGYTEAPRYFKINKDNHSGRRLYKLVGPGGKLLVTNACRMLGRGPNDHGKGDPEWLAENLKRLDDGADKRRIHVLLVCGRVAQQTFAKCDYTPLQATVIEMPHPAARQWTIARLDETALQIQTAIGATQP